MPASRKAVKATIKVLEELNRVPPEDKNCLTQLFKDISTGQEPIRRHENREGFYLPIVKCNHRVALIDNPSDENEVIVIGIDPYP